MANCLIQDVDCTVDTAEAGRAYNHSKHSHLPIRVSRHTWLAAHTTLLAGSQIGPGSVVSVGGLCRSLDLAPDHLGAGNPIVRGISIDAIERLRAR